MSDATALAAAIREGRTTARAAMEQSLAAASAREGFGAVVHLDAVAARAAAAAADAVPPDQRGPFHGVPFLVKDLGGAARGLPAAAGSAALRRRRLVPRADCDLMKAFRTSGLLPFGLTATPPFGLSLSCEPEALPPTRNPWNPDLTPGGSSGGAAAAVAAGIVAIAHATDAAGSIRVPAACCGLTGLKPSRGSVPGGPDFRNHLMGIVSELVLARSVCDVEATFQAVRQPGVAPPARIQRRVGLALPERCGAAQRRAADAAADALRDAGYEVQEIPAPDRIGSEAQEVAWTILAVSLAEWLAALDISDDEVPPLAAAMAAEGRRMPATELFATAREGARLADAASALFSEADALLMPMLAAPPPPVGAFDLSGTNTTLHRERLGAFAPNAALANVAGLPALVLPFGCADGLPLGVQLIGPRGADQTLLDLGAEIEARAPALSFPFPIAGLPA
ncbi:amidase family protein [Roseobacter sinensis]|uniref:Amidase family protein n=1 Tax=Roseobacter sinensis TaxID=2931391 RepID=A0ABT3BAU1_9RHOB|nr:amidase family protein [Roseobacter sp. WL0113]MCV3270696.1 amidase family protein [Roseobacter sp. WL0113]